ncbi:MAG: hypothetical protein ACM3PX_10470 [Omnitrophica WOR_2 bacterium]|jgi:hypothetical protein
METNSAENLKRLIERIKSFSLFDRLFRWHIIRSLLVDAASDLQGLITGIDMMKSDLSRIESEKSNVNKDFMLTRETSVKQESEIARLNGLFPEKDMRIAQLSNDLASEKTLTGALNNQINTITSDLRLLKENLNTRSEENDKLKKDNATMAESIQNLKTNNADLINDLTALKEKIIHIESDLANTKKLNTQLVTAEDSRKAEHSNAVASLQRLQEQVLNDRNREVEERHEAEKDRMIQMKKLWSEHQRNVKLRIKQICDLHTIEYIEKVPFKGTPDNTIKIAGEYIVFDAKSPASDNLANLPQYLKTQSESAGKYIKEESVKKEVFLVVPSNTLETLEQFVFNLADYTVFVISIDALEPVILSLKKIEQYEFAEQLDPEDRENICRIIGKFAHLSKRRVQIDSYFARLVFELAYSCESILPPDIHEKVIEFEKSEKLNPAIEKRAKQINIKELQKDNDKIKAEALTQGMLIKDKELASEIDKIPLYES